MITDRAAVLDTCVLINLLATDRIAEIVQAIAPTCFVCSAVCGESLYLRPHEPDAKPEPVRLDPLLTSGVLTICGIEGTAQEELYVKYALELDDGEAMSLAIAQARNFALATDERKARRVIRESRLQVRVISTPEVIRAWARGKARAELATVLRTIEARARFRPSSADPLEAWWCGLVDE